MYSVTISGSSMAEFANKVLEFSENFSTTKGAFNANPEPSTQLDFPIQSDQKTAQKRSGRPRKSAAPTPRDANEDVTDIDEENNANDNETDEANSEAPGSSTGEQEQSPVTRDDVLSVFQEYHLKFKLEACKELLKVFGAAKIGQIREDQFAEFKKACEKRLAKGE